MQEKVDYNKLPDIAEVPSQIDYSALPDIEEPIKKKEESVVGVGESGVSPSLSSTPDREFLQDTEVIAPELPQSKEILSFQAEQKKEEVPNFMGLLTEGYQEQPVGVVKSISEGLSKAERPIEDKFASYVDRKRAELTGGVQLPNPLAAQTPEQYNQALSEYTRILRENPMAEKEDNKITAIRMLIDKTKETDRVVSDYSQRTIAGNLGTGLKKGLEDYGRGYFELFDRLKQNDAIKDLNVKLEALDRGENVSFDEGEKILAQALVDNGNKIKELEELSPSAFNIGKMAGESLGFTGEFLLTGGIGAGASKAITKGLVAKAAEGAAISRAKKMGVGLAAKMAQTGIQVGSMPTFYKGIAEDVSKGKNFGESLFENYYRTFSENFTERIFLRNPWDKATVGAVDNFMGRLGVNMHTDKGLVGILASTAEETAEEKIGELMTAPLDYNNFDKFWNDYWNVKKNAELIGSIAVMTAPAGLVSYGVKKYDDVQLNRIGKLLPSGIRSEIDQVLDDQKLTLKAQYDLVGRIVEDHAKDRTLGDRPAEAAGNIIRYVEKKTKSNVVSAVEDRAQTPTVGTMEEVSTEDQAKVDYLDSKGVKIPDGSTMAVVSDLYEKEKQKEPSVVDEQKQKEEVVSVAAEQGSKTEPKEEAIKPIEAISEPVEPPSPQKEPIVSPEQKEVLKQTKQDVVVGGVDGEQVDILNTDTDSLEKIQSDIEASNVDLDKKLFRDIDRELEKREWHSVILSPLSEIKNIIQSLKKKNKEKPNGFGSYIENRDANEVLEVVERYSKNVSIEEAKSDFKKSFFGNPSTWYADGLMLREAARVYIENGGTFKELLRGIQKEFESDGFSESDAASFVKRKLDEISRVNLTEQQRKQQPSTIKQNIPLQEQIIEVKQVKQQENGKETSDEAQGRKEGRKEKLLKKNEEADALLSEGLSDIADLLGTKLSLTGEQRVKVKDAVRKVARGLILKGEVKAEQLAMAIKDYFSKAGHDISDELINETLEEEGYAEGIRTTASQAGQQAQGVVKGEKGRIRLGDDAKDRVEAPKRKRVSELGDNEAKDSRLGIRWAWGKKYSEEAQAKFREQGLYSYKPESHSEVEAAARSIVDNNSEEDALRTMRDNNVSRRIRTAIGILLIDKMDARVNELKSKGKDKEANDVVSDIKDTMKFIQDEFATEAGRDESFFGSNMVMTRLGGYTLARMAQLGMDASRTNEMEKKRFKRVENLAKEELGKARKEAVDATIKKVVPPKQKNVDTKIQEIRKKRSSLIDQWKKARESGENTYSVIIPGLTQVDIEYGGRIAATYIEEGIYQTDKLIKKLKKVFDQVGVEVKDSDLKKLIPETYNGVPFSQYQEERELGEAADMLAQRIFGDVIDKKAPAKDPIKIMVDTLFAKFRETQLDRKKTEKMSDIEKLSLAIKESREYKKAWTEAKDYAISKIQEDKNLSDEGKATAIERVEKAYKNATELVFSDKLIKDLVRKEISERDMDVAEIVRDHYDRRGAIKEDLKKSLIEKAGLTDSEAKILSNAVDSTFETLLADRVSKVVKKFTEKGKRAATAKQLKGADQVLYFTRIGAFDNAEFREAFADMWGIPKLTEEDVDYIIDKHKKIQRIKGEAMRYEEKQKLLAYIANLQGMDWNELIDGIWYANVLSGSGTQLKNLLDANTAALVEPMIIAGTSPFKRARLRNAIGRAVTGRAWSNLKYTLETGNHPFDFGQETPKLSKRVLETKDPLVKNKLQWGAIKALSRYQNIFFDIMMANDAFAGTLAYESMIDVLITDAAYSKARKEAGRRLTKKEKEALNRKIDELLRITPEDQEIIKKTVDQESEDYKKIQAEEGKNQTGYSERQRIQRTFELMDEMRPVDMVEDARRISLEAVGNINPYGTLGWVMGVVTNVANNFGATFSKPVIVKSGNKFVLSTHPTDKITIKPLQKVVPFTRIITNIATRNLNWNPIIAGIRATTGKYGTFVLNKKGASGKFIREMSAEERKIIVRKIFYTAAIASLAYALTGGDDPENGLIRITGNGTGDFEKNKQLRQAGWKPWSIQIGDFSISYQYIYPLNMILSPIGWARDQQLYNDSEDSFAYLYGNGVLFSIGQVLFSTPMSGISSAFDTMGSLVFEGVDSFTDKLAKMTSMIGGGFVSPRVFDDIDKLFGIVSDRADIEGVTLSEKFADRVPFVGRNFAGKVEAIDLFGDNIPLQSPADAVISTKVRGKNAELTKWMVEDIGYFRPQPSFKETTFIVMEKDGSINKKRKLVEGNDEEGAFWTEYNKKVGSIFKEKAMAIKTLDKDKEQTKEMLKDAWEDSRKLAIAEMYLISTGNPLESTQIE
jgi:hypothetical protein